MICTLLIIKYVSLKKKKSKGKTKITEIIQKQRKKLILI
jgi:hypothetical protein